MDALDQVEQGMGFGGDEPSHFLRLKESDEAEIVIYKSAEVVPATQKEQDGGYCNPDGNTVEYTFTSPFSGNTRTHRANAQGLLIGLKNADTQKVDETDGKKILTKVNEGDVISIKRTGAGGDTRHNVTILTNDQVDDLIKQRSAAKPESSLADGHTNADVADDTGAPKETEAPSNASDEQINIEDIPF